MNERILELYRQAHVPYTAIDPSNNMPYQTATFSAEKFAELIVRECSAMAWWAEQYGMGDGKPISKQITEHFGVES